MKIYAAIGHFKDSKNVTSVVLEQTTKKAFMHDCYGNEFVPYVVLTEAMFKKTQTCESSMEVFEMVKKMTTNYRVWDVVTEYLCGCGDMIDDKMQNVRERI